MNKRIKKLRIQLGLTGSAFGNVIGLSKMAVSNIENGKHGITEQTIKSIIREFKVNELWLRDGIGEMFSEKSREEQIMEFVADIYREEDQFKLDFISTISQLTEEEWKLLNSICVKLAAIEKKEP